VPARVDGVEGWIGVGHPTAVDDAAELTGRILLVLVPHRGRDSQLVRHIGVIVGLLLVALASQLEQFTSRIAHFTEDRAKGVQALLDGSVRRRNGAQIVGGVLMMRSGFNVSVAAPRGFDLPSAVSSSYGAAGPARSLLLGGRRGRRPGRCRCVGPGRAVAVASAGGCSQPRKLGRLRWRCAESAVEQSLAWRASA